MAPHGEKLKASNEDDLVKVKVNDKEINANPFVTTDESVDIQLTASESGVYEIPCDEEISVELNDTDKNGYELVDLEMVDELPKWQRSLIETLESRDDKESIFSTDDKSVLKILKNESKQSFFFKLKKDQTIKFKITYKSKSCYINNSNVLYKKS